MDGPIRVYKYNRSVLLDLFQGDPKIISKELITKKTHFEYFNEYLSSKYMKAKTIVVETHYIDRDFLEDFSSYYVRCFTEYKRTCSRLHFFSNQFLQDEFDAFLEKYDPEFERVLQANYLGFIVIKPLPQTIVGRTCLKTYAEKPELPDKRVFPVRRDNEVNLCGMNLTVKSLAFQEQDSVVSACATSALWSAFQVTAKLFQHKILPPVEITKSATEHFPLQERPFPNKGLNIEQMMHAVKELGMEPFLLYVEDDENTLKNYIYSYLTYGIPIILVIDLYNTDANGISNYEGRHAVVITGYRLQTEVANSDYYDNLRLVSSYMTKFYVHDDQIGPFAKMKMDSKKIIIKNGDKETVKITALDTEWKFRAVPIIILIPLYHKIRIPLENILAIVEIFNSIIDESIKNIEDEMLPAEKLEWDIFLTNIARLKNEILSKSGKEGNFKNILKTNMPRFLWRATARYMRKPVMDLLFDATDIEQGNLFLCGIVYNREIFSAIRLLVTSHKNASNHFRKHPSGKALLEWLKHWAG